MKLLKFIFLIFSFFCSFANASINTFYFTTTWGEEIRVEVLGSFDKPVYYFTTSHRASELTLAKEYIHSTLEKRNYIYSWQDDCGRDCNVALGINGSESDNPIMNSFGILEGTEYAEKSIIRGYPKQGNLHTLGKTRMKVNDTNPNSTANKFVEGFSTELGGSVGKGLVERIFSLIEPELKRESRFIFFVDNGTGKPEKMCDLRGNVCEEITEVSFFETSDGEHFGITYPVALPGTDNSDYLAELNEAIRAWGNQKLYECKVVFTNSGGRPVPQVVCYVKI